MGKLNDAFEKLQALIGSDLAARPVHLATNRRLRATDQILVAQLRN
jgi:hypothetical protein